MVPKPLVYSRNFALFFQPLYKLILTYRTVYGSIRLDLLFFVDT